MLEGDPTALLPHGTLLCALERAWMASLAHWFRMRRVAVEVDLLMAQSMMTAVRRAV